MRTKLNRLLMLGTAFVCFVSFAFATTSSKSAIENQMHKMEVSSSVSTSSSFFYKAKKFLINGAEELAYKYEETKDSLSMNNAEAFAGDQIVLPVSLVNSNQITGLQFDLYLPKGITIAKNNRGKYLVNFAEGRVDGSSHTVTAAEQKDGAIRVLAFSTMNDTFIGNSGDLFNITLDISSSLKEGDYNIEIKNIVLSTPDSKRLTSRNSSSIISVATYILGDANNDRHVDVTDISEVVSFILAKPSQKFNSKAADVNRDNSIDVADISELVNLILKSSVSTTSPKFITPKATLGGAVEKGTVEILPFTLKANEEKKIQVLLKSAPDTWFSQAQFDFYLPKGVSVKSKKVGPKSKWLIEQGYLSGGHNIGSAPQENESHFRVVLSSFNNDYFYPKDEDITVQEGEIAIITLCGAPDLKEGVHELRINNVVLATDKNTSAKPEEYITSIIFGNPVLKQVALKGHYTPEVANSICTALNSKEITTIDFTQASNIDANTSFKTGNPNTLFYLNEGMELGNSCNVVIGDQCQNLLLTDGYDFNTTKPFVAQNASYTRNIANKGWYSICLPFSTKINDNTLVEKFVSFDESKTAVKFEKVTSIQANMPYLFNADKDIKFEASNIEVPVATTLNDGIFYGTLSEVHNLNNKFELKNDGTNFIMCKENVLPAFRAYLETERVTTEKIKVNHDETTSIEDVTIEEGLFPADVYTVDGKLVKKQAKNTEGLSHGIYIVNGKKVIK